MDLNFWKKEFPKKVTNTCKVAGEKSSQLIEEAKLRLNIANLNDKISDIMESKRGKQFCGDWIKNLPIAIATFVPMSWIEDLWNTKLGVRHFYNTYLFLISLSE